MPPFPRRLLARWLARRARRRSLSTLLAKPDDRLIDDIGRTRDELRRMVEELDPGNDEGAARRPPPVLCHRGLRP